MKFKINIFKIVSVLLICILTIPLNFKNAQFSEISTVAFAKENNNTSTKISKPSITVLKNSANSVKITWKKIKKASGYKIYHSTSRQGKYKLIKTINSGKTTNYTKTKLSSVEHYFKVRAFYKDNTKNIYSEYSNIKVVNLITKDKIESEISRLKKKFPDGKYWNHKGIKVKADQDTSNMITDKPCEHGADGLATSCNCYVGVDNVYGYQCYGFASKLSDEVFGKKAAISTHKIYNKAKVGDNVRVNDAHSMFIISKTKEYIIVAEANIGYTCLIKWGRKVYKSELKNAYYTTRY